MLCHDVTCGALTPTFPIEHQWTDSQGLEQWFPLLNVRRLRLTRCHLHWHTWGIDFGDIQLHILCRGLHGFMKVRKKMLVRGVQIKMPGCTEPTRICWVHFVTLLLCFTAASWMVCRVSVVIHPPIHTSSVIIQPYLPHTADQGQRVCWPLFQESPGWPWAKITE